MQPIRLGFNKIIFVLEDVDAATMVVHKRTGDTAAIEEEEPESDALSNNDMMQVRYKAACAEGACRL